MLAPEASGRAARCIEVLCGGDDGLAPWTVPDGAILDGAPRLRGRVLGTGPDGRPRGGVWECEPCRLEVDTDGDELLVVLEGALVIQTGHGTTVSLGPGDVAWLPAGVTCVVTVRKRCRCAFGIAAGPAAG